MGDLRSAFSRHRHRLRRPRRDRLPREISRGRDPGPQQHQVRIHPCRVSRPPMPSAWWWPAGLPTSWARARHSPLPSACGASRPCCRARRFRSSPSQWPCFCSAWARRQTFPPASRPSLSGFPSASARWPPASSTPAPISATSPSRLLCRSSSPSSPGAEPLWSPALWASSGWSPGYSYIGGRSSTAASPKQNWI